MSLHYRNAAEVWEHTAKALKNPPKGIPLPSWPRFTELTGGLRPNEITLLCAPTGAGKTQLLANLSVQLIAQKVPHFVAPVETGDEDFLARVASVFAKKDLNSGEPIAADVVDGLGKGFKKSEAFKHMYLATYDNRVEIHEMLNLLKYMHQEYGVKVALLDNLNFFLKVVSSQNERAEMDSAIHEFVMLAKKLPIHVILIVHPKKTEGGRVESEFDIKGSSTAVQECSNCCLFNRPTKEDIATNKAKATEREMVFKKLRKRGTSINKIIRFEFSGGRYGEIK